MKMTYKQPWCLGLGLACSVLVLVLGVSEAAQAGGPSVSVTAADIADAARLKVTYLHAAPAEGHVLTEEERAQPEPLAGPSPLVTKPRALVTKASGATHSYDPDTLTYDADTGGAVVVSARIHNVFVNCKGSGPTGNVIARCWGTVGTDPHSVPTPDQVAADFNASGYSHVTDQYVGSTATNRYPLGLDVNVSYAFPNKQASITDVSNVLTAAVKALGTQYAGYGDLYLLYFPVGTDVCTASTCLSYGTICSYHLTADGVINGTPVHAIYAAIPYQDLPGCRVILGPNEVNDSMASAIGQQLGKMITDPDGDAWKNTTNKDLVGYEIGDECLLAKFIRFPTVTLPATAQGHPYKMQLLYSNAAASCVDQP